mgnify:CR=1 FL=1
MRLDLATQLKTRTGEFDRDAKIKNGYTEIRNDSGSLRKRPGVVDIGSIGTGSARLLSGWGTGASVHGDTLSILTVSMSSTADVVGTLNGSSSPLSSESTGESQTLQQLFIKDGEQAWIYTR